MLEKIGGRLAGLGLGFTLMTTTSMFAVVAVAQAQETVRTHEFRIPAQNVASALVRFSALTGFSVVYDGTLPGNARSKAVAGRLSEQQALQQLLSGTGLTFRFGANDTVTIIAPPAVTGAVSADGTTVLGAIVVEGESGRSYVAGDSSVGTKTDTPLRDVPQSIQVVKRSVIEDQQATSLTQALENVSNVRESSTAGNRAATYITRGFASNTYAIDGSVLNATGSRPEVNPDLAGIERVEVLKGPASVLYGRGEPGGLINLVTRRPTPTPTAEVKTQVGSFGFRRAEATASGALNEDGTLTGRVTGAAQREEGFVDERRDSERQYIGGVLEWAPDEDTKVSLSVDHTRQEQPYDRGLIVTEDNEINWPAERFLGERWSMVDSHKTRVALTAEHQALDWLKFRGSVRYDAALTHDTGIDFEGLDEDDSSLMTRRYTDRIEDMQNFNGQFEGIMTFDTGNIGHTVLAGVERVHSRMDFWRRRASVAPINIYDPVYGAPMLPATSGALEYIQDIVATSVYLQDQIDISDQWKLLGGLRYDTFESEMGVRVGSGEPATNDSAMTGRIGLVYQPTNTTSLYTSYSTSFMPQNGFGVGNTALDAQEGWQIEAGIKADLTDRISATFSVFQITKSNVAVDVAGEDYSILTGEQRSRGAELDITGEITDGWQVIASLGYVDAEITKDDNYQVGNRLVGAPRWSGSLWTTYEFQTGTLEGLKLGTGVTAVGKRTGDLDNSFYVDGYYRVDASVSYKINDNLDFSLIGRNLTDQRYIESTASRTENHAGAPINFMAALKASF
ncbi:TonB-dependent siderophore receptor [Neorhizobium sp. JUb45]|uniref:TonB-dependent siderophore receptor n=1 Tax=unclassified Neorhizobium TaxID=2629175 RepID=UPI001052D2C2|nr:TonB-dependent siderophore receptor [Neorhizobium sp. JUb45]TCR02710.1 iron complex outermembrane receptor protein [Neorhizobium sp. JUb45]